MKIITGSFLILVFLFSAVSAQLSIKNSAGSTVLYITQNEQVGIGTTSITANKKLEVNGTTKTSVLQVGNSSTAEHVLVASSTDGTASWGTVGSVGITDNSLTAADLAVNVVSSISGVTNDGGNIDLLAGNGITITPNDANNTITIGATGYGGLGTRGSTSFNGVSGSLSTSWQDILTITVPAGEVIILAQMFATVNKTSGTGGIAAVDMRLYNDYTGSVGTTTRVCNASQGLESDTGTGTLVYSHSSNRAEPLKLQARVSVYGATATGTYYGSSWQPDYGDITALHYFAFHW